jgi:GNAT superfamily N-acetyltransferase
MGGGEPLAADVKARLCDDLARLPGAVSWLAWLDQQPVGLLNALQGYSSFKARPLMNVHDIAVDPAQRGKGIGQALLKALEEHAQQLGCCNSVAKQSYARFGFEQYTLSALTGQALFMQKWL